jgi:hypothetical protein
MRRLSVLVVLVGALIAVTTGRADAHNCPVAALVAVGQTSTVNVAITIESVPVPDVEIDVPDGLRLDRVDRVPGWTFTRNGQVVRYHGPPFDPITCQYFSIGVTPLRKGAFLIPVVQRDANGTVLSRTAAGPTERLATVVYAGVKIPGPSGSNGPSITTIVGGALIGLGLVFALVMAIRSRRARRADEREVELEDRLDAFKKQARDRRPDPDPDPDAGRSQP